MKRILFIYFLSQSLWLEAAAPSHNQWNALLQKNVTLDGKVNYKGFISDKDQLEKYLNLLSKTKFETSWTKQEQMAYLINAYNAYTVKLIIDYYPVSSIKDIGAKVQIPFVNTPWDIKFIPFGNDSVDLNFIEHGNLLFQYFFQD